MDPGLGRRHDARPFPGLFFWPPSRGDSGVLDRHPRLSAGVEEKGTEISPQSVTDRNLVFDAPRKWIYQPTQTRLDGLLVGVFIA